MILDEPFSGLDPVNSQILKDVVNELIADGKLVIFSSHQMSYVEEFCENIAIINKGEVVLEGNLHEIKKDYGKSRLMLVVSGEAPADSAESVAKVLDGVAVVEEVRKNCLVLALTAGHTRKDVMESLAKSDLEVEHFGSYEPSLNDIFVAKVGEEGEDKHE